MAYVRTTIDMREKIVQRLIEYRFKAEVEAMVDWQDQLAHQAYQEGFLKIEHEIMAGLPQAWLPVATHVRFQVGPSTHDQVSLPFNGRQFEKGNLYSMARPRDNIYKPFPACKNGGVLKIFDDDSVIGKSYHLMVAAKDDLVKRVEEARKQAKVAVNAVSTIGAMINNWPEIEPFVRDFMRGEPVANLPMLPVPKLNAIFDLPAAQSVEIAKPKETV